MLRSLCTTCCCEHMLSITLHMVSTISEYLKTTSFWNTWSSIINCSPLLHIGTKTNILFKSINTPTQSSHNLHGLSSMNFIGLLNCSLNCIVLVFYSKTDQIIDMSLLNKIKIILWKYLYKLTVIMLYIVWFYSHMTCLFSWIF